VPAKLTPDGFERDTGRPVPKAGKGKNAARGTPAGSERQADRINAPGPR
jgi:hypothetical protein